MNKTQNDLAAALGVHPNTVSAWVRGKYAPSVENLYRVLLFCGWMQHEVGNQPMREWFLWSEK